LTGNGGPGLSEGVHDGSLTATSGTDQHKAVTYLSGFVQLNALGEEGGLVHQVHGLEVLFDGSLHILVDLGGNIGLPGENILDQ